MQVVAFIAAALIGTAAAGGYGPAPVAPSYPAPVAKPCPPATAPVAPVAPIVVAPAPTVTVVAPVVTKPKVKVHTCGGWNNKYNKKGCASVNAVKCTLGSGKGSKYQPCSEAVCCGAAPAPPAPQPSPVTPTYTIVTCAQFCSSNNLQCVVITTGGCALEGAYNGYQQCSKALCCGTPAPQPPAPQPQPQIVSCKQVVGAYWKCPVVASYSCSVGAAYGPYPACGYDVCCLNPNPNPVDPCKNCGLYCPSWCPSYDPCANCGNYCPPQCNKDPCANCGGPYQPACPSQCGGPVDPCFVPDSKECLCQDPTSEACCVAFPTPGCSKDPCVINPTTEACICANGADDACCAAFPSHAGCAPLDPCIDPISAECCALDCTTACSDAGVC